MGLYIIIMGVQGAGKGEQAKFISQKYGIPQVSTGDLMRAMRTREDALAKRVQAIMAEGRLVDDDTTNEILVERLSQPDAQNGVLLDGYPRNESQADFLADFLAQKGEKVSAVLFLDLDLYVAFKRAFGRVTAKSGDSYNIFFKSEGMSYTVEKAPEDKYPPRVVATLNSTGEELSRRADDANPLAVLKRIDSYVAETMPLIAYYQAKGLVKTIPADQSIEAVSAQIASILNALK